MNSDLVYSQQWNIRLRDNYPQAIDLVAHCIEELIHDSGIPREKIIGVGLGMAGLIDAEQGCCIDSWHMNWRNVEISRPCFIFFFSRAPPQAARKGYLNSYKITSNVDKNAAYPKAFNELQAEGAIPDPCDLTSASSISTPSSNKITASSNDASNQG